MSHIYSSLDGMQGHSEQTEMTTALSWIFPHLSIRSGADVRFIFSDAVSNKCITKRDVSFVAFKRQQDGRTASHPACATTGSGFVGYSACHVEQDACHTQQPDMCLAGLGVRLSRVRQFALT